jgi:hypothetical protein
MFSEGRRQWIKKLLSSVFGITGLATLGSAISGEEAQAVARSLLPASTEHGAQTCPQTYVICPANYTYCPNCHGTFICPGNYTSSSSVV